MNTSYAMNTYRSHDLNIAMKTSSGDVIKMDFSNEQSTSLNYKSDGNATTRSMRFSSMQSFQFSIKSNGIDEQDKKEIAAFMQKAQPFIDKFLKELEEDAPKSPVTKIAKKIAGIFQPNEQRSDVQNKHIKTNIVKMFDNSLEKIAQPQDIFKEAQKLLEKTLKEFDKLNQEIYA